MCVAYVCKRACVQAMVHNSRDIDEILTRMNDLVTGEIRRMSKRFVTQVTAEWLLACKEE